jgi:hypothetical protein
MGKTTELPGPLTKRELLHSESEIDCRKYGDMFYDAERYNDAIDFYAKGKCEEELLKVKKIAIREGDYFLLKRLVRVLPGKVEKPDWAELAKNAESKGKANFAQWASEEEKGRGAPAGGQEGEEL